MENVLIGLLGSLLVLDTTVAFQFLISQPLITSTLLGWFLGDMQLGLEVGFYLQLLWLSSMPVGAAIVPEGNIAAIVITALVLRYNAIYHNFYTLLVTGIIYGILVSFVGGELVVLYRKINVKLMQKLLYKAKMGYFFRLSRINLTALFLHYVLMFILITIALFCGDILYGFFESIPADWEQYFRYGSIGIIGIGVGLILPLYREKSNLVFIIIGLVAGIFFFMILR